MEPQVPAKDAGCCSEAHQCPATRGTGVAGCSPSCLEGQETSWSLGFFFYDTGIMKGMVGIGLGSGWRCPPPARPARSLGAPPPAASAGLRFLDGGQQCSRACCGRRFGGCCYFKPGADSVKTAVAVRSGPVFPPLSAFAAWC